MGFGLREKDGGGINRERREELDLQREVLDLQREEGSIGFPERGGRHWISRERRGIGFAERELDLQREDLDLQRERMEAL